MALPDDNLPTASPVEVEYKRYRHRRKGTVVVVINVTNHPGTLGYYTAVTVEEKGGKQVTWPGTVFLKTFEPIGRKIRPNRYTRLRGKKDLV